MEYSTSSQSLKDMFDVISWPVKYVAQRFVHSLNAGHFIEHPNKIAVGVDAAAGMAADLAYCETNYEANGVTVTLSWKEIGTNIHVFRATYTRYSQTTTIELDADIPLPRIKLVAKEVDI